MQKFLALPKEKQDAIIEAAYSCFGQMGYKKASVADIAAKAGISKAMVFHYFGCKKKLYLHLFQLSLDEMDQVTEEYDVSDDTDFFSRFLAKIQCQSRMLLKHPSVIAFLLSVRNEDDPEVEGELKEILCQRKNFQNEMHLLEMDITRFKDGVQPELVFHLLSNYIENIARRAALNEISDLDSILEEITACVEMLRANLYKEG
ncbi:MAG: TetR/AcrR family transcriptional regulator [Dorea sp.]